MPILPRAATIEEFRQLGRSDPRIQAGAAKLCERLDVGPLRLIASGSLPVFEARPEHVLKLYPPCFAHEATHERTVLEFLQGRLPITVPRVDAGDEIDGWEYLLMSRMPGEPLADVWPRLEARDRSSIAAQTGRLLRALHALQGLERIGSQPAWPAFLDAQRRGCVEWQRARGTDPGWLEQIPAFLGRAGVPDVTTSSLLHTEIMREHLFAAPTATGWSLTGLIDFEPAMVGAPEYEFASVGLFLTCGDGPALRALLLAYGYAESELGPALQRRFLAYALLHRYSNLRWYLERLPVPETVPTLDELATRWWAVDETPALR